MFAECLNVDPDYPNSFTGGKNCTAPCFEPGECFGSFIKSFNAITANECLDECKKDADCNYFSFNEDRHCTLTRDCVLVDDTCSTLGCLYGRVECEPRAAFVMVATGYNGTDLMDSVEIVHVQANKSCPITPPKYPIATDHAVALVDGGQIVVCGRGDECYKYDYESHKWIQIASMSQSRFAATAVEWKPNEWVISG